MYAAGAQRHPRDPGQADQFKVTFGQDMNHGAEEHSPKQNQAASNTGSSDPARRHTQSLAHNNEATKSPHFVLPQYQLKDCPNDLNIDFLIVSPPKPRGLGLSRSQRHFQLRPNPVYLSKQQILEEERILEELRLERIGAIEKK